MSKFQCGPKSSWEEEAKRIASGDISVADSELVELLEWVRDGNWPGFDTIVSYIASQNNRILDPLRVVLKSNDAIWIYWTLNKIIPNLTEGKIKTLGNDIWNIANQIDQEEAYLAALNICVTHKLIDEGRLKALCKERVRESRGNVDEFKRMLNFFHDN